MAGQATLGAAATGRVSISLWSGPLGLALRLLIVVLGLALFSLGSVLILRSRVGLGPWDVFHQGLTRHLPLTFGQASITTGFVVLLLAWACGARPGVATVLNMLLVGAFIDLYLWLGFVPDFGAWALPLRVAIDLTGVLAIGMGTALYIKGNLGAGPRDGLMLALARRTGGRVSIVRGAIEVLALAVGALLGGTAGIGTIIFALGAGPAVGLGFRLLRVRVVRADA